MLYFFMYFYILLYVTVISFQKSEKIMRWIFIEYFISSYNRWIIKKIIKKLFIKIKISLKWNFFNSEILF